MYVRLVLLVRIVQLEQILVIHSHVFIMEHVLLMVLNRTHVFVQQIILVLDVKYAIVHVLFIHVGSYWLLLLLEFNFVLGLNGGVCQSTINGGVI